MKYTLNREGNFYKGNLHAHTIRSDGKLTVEETIAVYKQHGYNFLGITDHMFYGYYPEHEDESFLSIPASEIHTSERGMAHHLVAVGDPKLTGFTLGSIDPALNQLAVQSLIDLIVSKNNLAIYCHPYWSRTGLRDIVSLEHIVGMEIYNHECEMEWKSGNAEVFYDHLLWNGKRAWCFGSDDTHSKDYTFCGGYITVKTADFSHQGILRAIAQGSFYASAARMGIDAPKIFDFLCEDGKAKLWCDPCRDLYFYFGCSTEPEIWSYSFKASHATANDPICYAEHEIPETAKYVKVSVQDFSGNNSWCQPIWLV